MTREKLTEAGNWLADKLMDAMAMLCALAVVAAWLAPEFARDDGMAILAKLGQGEMGYWWGFLLGVFIMVTIAAFVLKGMFSLITRCIEFALEKVVSNIRRFSHSKKGL